MLDQRSMEGFKNFRLLFVFLLLFSFPVRASFIESTIGTAVVNDATATYYNPAALTLLKNSQFITLGSIAYFRTQFSGQAMQPAIGFSQSGSESTSTHYFLPSFYLGVPIYNNMTVGLAVLFDFFGRDTEENSVLRYVQSNNSIQNIDLVAAVGFKFNDYFSLGAGLSISQAEFLLRPIFGFRSLTIPDAQSRNQSSATAWGGDVGFLLKPSKSTLFGFNYRTAITYNLSGTSVFEGNPRVISNNYRFTFWTPPRSVFSINHFLTSSLGLIGTIQYIQWSIFKNINIHGIATPIGILPNATVPYHFHNAWLLTVGSNYRITPKWVIRAAGSYNQSPANGHFQISNGDSIILGGSMAYEINKKITVDGSYAHAFIKNQNIHITNRRNIINGVNKGSRDSVSLKLTINV